MIEKIMEWLGFYVPRAVEDLEASSRLVKDGLQMDEDGKLTAVKLSGKVHHLGGNTKDLKNTGLIVVYKVGVAGLTRSGAAESIAQIRAHYDEQQEWLDEEACYRVEGGPKIGYIKTVFVPHHGFTGVEVEVHVF